MDEARAGDAGAVATAPTGTEGARGVRHEVCRVWDSRGLRTGLTVLGGLGVLCVLVWAAFWAVFDLNGPDPRDSGGFELYLDVAQVWAVGIVALGICRAYGRRWSGVGAPATWLFWCDLGLLLAALWPIQALIAAGLYARYARESRWWVRGVAALAGVAVVLGGGAWAVTGYEAEQPWRSAQVTDLSFLGTWRTADGATIEIRPGGVFSAAGFTQNGPDAWWPAQLANAQGSWSLSHGDGVLTLTLKQVPPDGDAEHNATLDIYGRFAPATLCLDDGFYDPCDLGLHR